MEGARVRPKPAGISGALVLVWMPSVPQCAFRSYNSTNATLLPVTATALTTTVHGLTVATTWDL